MEIKIDLKDLGIVEYDEGGDPMPGPDLTDLIVAEAARMLIGSDRDLRKRVEETVAESVKTEVDAKVKVLVEEIVTGPIQRTTVWGEKKGEPTSLKEIIRETSEKWLTGDARRGAYDSRDTPAKSMQELVSQETAAFLSYELRQTIDSAKKAVTDKVVDEVLLAVKDRLGSK